MEYLLKERLVLMESKYNYCYVLHSAFYVKYENNDFFENKPEVGSYFLGF